MLDYFCVFTKGGTLLWALSFVGGAGLKGDPVNALIRGCLLEERAGQGAFEYLIPSGGAYALKWALNNVRARCYCLSAAAGLPACPLLPASAHLPWCPASP